MLIRSGVAVAASSACERLVALAGVVVLSRLIAPAEFGAFALTVSMLTIAGQLLDFGAHFALISRRSIDPATVWAHALLQVGGAVVILLVAVAARPIALAVFGEPTATLLPVIAATRVILAVGITSRVLMDRDFRFVALGVVNVVAASVSLLLGIALALRGHGVWALALGAGPPSLAGATVQTAGYLMLRPLEFRGFTVDRDRLRWYLHYGRPMWLGTQAVSVGTQLDNIAIGTFLGPGPLGFYDRAYRLVQTLVALVNQTFGRIALSAYSRLQSQDHAQARRAEEINTALLLRAALPLAAFLAIAAPNVIEVLIGARWRAAGALLMLLAPYFLLRVLDENLLAYFMGAGRTWERTLGWLIVAAVSVPALLILVPTVGAAGAPIGVGLAMAAGVVWQQVRVAPERFRQIAADSLRPLVAAVGAAVAALAIGGVVGTTGGPAGLALKGVTLGLAYLALLVSLERTKLRELTASFRAASRVLVS